MIQALLKTLNTHTIAVLQNPAKPTAASNQFVPTILSAQAYTHRPKTDPICVSWDNKHSENVHTKFSAVFARSDLYGTHDTHTLTVAVQTVAFARAFIR